MSETKKATAAQLRAVAKYEKKTYFKTLVRFPINKESDIRAAAGDSLNGFIVSAVLEKIERDAGRGDHAENKQNAGRDSSI